MGISCRLCFSFICLLASMVRWAESDDKPELHIGALLPFTGVWPGGEAMLASSSLALDSINAHPDVLPGYTLNITYRDSEFKVYEGTRMLHDLLTTPPTKVVVLAAANSELSEASALVSELWNLCCVSYASVSPVLSDKKTFPRFFRTSAPDTAVNPARINVMKTFGWEKAALLHQSRAVFDAVADDLKERFHVNNLTLIADEVFQYQPAAQVKALKARDARIIITIANVDKALLIFCEAYKNQMYGPRYVWMTVGWYDDNWWMHPGANVDCTTEQLVLVAEGYIAVGDLTLNPIDKPGIGGITSSQWLALYDEKTNYTKPHASNLAPQAYDAVWAIALALNQTEAQLIASGSPKRLFDLHYTDTAILDMIFHNLKNVEFVGVKAPIVFDTNQDPIIMTKINRVQGGVRELVGIYHPDGPNDGFIDWFNDTPLIWEGGKPPLDSTTYVSHKVFVPTPVYAVFCILATLGILLALGFLAINVIYRKVRIIKMSSPNINNLILLGCILMYLTVFFQEHSTSQVTSFCRARLFLMVIGFALSFGALFSKTWRIHIIFANKQMKRKVVKDWELGILVAVLLVVDLIVLVVWEIMDPKQHTNVKISEEEVGDQVNVYYLDRCKTGYSIYFVGTLYIIQGLLLIFGAFLAYETRKVTIPALNDSQYIGMCLYNVMILSIMAVIMSYVLGEQITLHYSLLSGFLILGTTMTLCLIFVPKVLKLKESRVTGESDEDNSVKSQVTATTITSAKVDKPGPNAEELERKMKETENKLKEKEELIRQLLAQIGSGEKLPEVGMNLTDVEQNQSAE